MASTKKKASMTPPPVKISGASWPHLKHPIYDEARETCFTACATAEPGDIILITGATGAGKTYLLNDMAVALVGPSASWEGGCIPLVRVKLDVDGRGVAMIKEAIVELNRGLGNPFLAHDQGDNARNARFRMRIATPEGGLRDSFRFLAAQRRTRYVFLDEIQHINPARRAAAMARLESIKMIAGCSGSSPSPGDVVLVLAGHYSILKVLEENAQVGRRTTVVSMRTYNEESESDIQAWQEILSELDSVYPMGPGSLCDWNDVLFRMAIGDIGLLRVLLDGANKARIKEGSRVLTPDHLLEAMPIDGIFESLAKDVLAARSALKRSKWEIEIRALNSRKKPAASQAKQRGKRRGVRKLAPRDPVGGR